VAATVPKPAAPSQPTREIRREGPPRDILCERSTQSSVWRPWDSSDLVVGGRGWATRNLLPISRRRRNSSPLPPCRVGSVHRCSITCKSTTIGSSLLSSPFFARPCVGLGALGANRLSPVMALVIGGAAVRLIRGRRTAPGRPFFIGWPRLEHAYPLW
jgi:hypothetical protein